MACAHRRSASRAAIFAGHFGTKLVRSLRDGWNATHASSGSRSSWQGQCGAYDPLACAECLVVLREPIDRLIDAYTFFDERSTTVPFEKLTGEELVAVPALRLDAS